MNYPITLSKQFLKVYNEGPLGMAIIGIDHKFIAVNNRLCEITGYQEEELLQKTFPDITFPEDIENDLKSAQQLYDNEISHHDVEKRYIKKDNSVVWVRVTVAIVKGEDGIPQYNLAMIDDIDAKKKMVLELEKMNNDKDKFFSIIAHDLKSPLATLAGISEILVEEINDLKRDEIKELAEVIQSSTRMTLNLLEDLLDWSRYNSGKIAFDPEPLDLNNIINELARLYRLNIAQKKIMLSVKSDGEIKVIADRNMIYTSLRNLLSNAIKFSKIGGDICIEVEKLEKESLPEKKEIETTNSNDMSNSHNKKNKSFVKISVRDNGVGIKKERIDSLFMFDSMKSTMGTDNELGTGLGLILVKEFIEKHKGTVSVESEPDIGSNFIVEIPCV